MDDERPTRPTETQVSLGPLFTLGAVLLALGFLRRRPLLVATGVAAVWLDQRSELGQALKAAVRQRLEGGPQPHARG